MSMSDPSPRVLADLALARRLEHVEARGSVAFVEARARLSPAVGATWREVTGTVALFDGPGSPITQTFGLGMTRAVKAAHMEEIEAFFRERGAPVFHEVSPLADPSALALLVQRDYRPVEFTSVMFRELAGDLQVNAARNPRLAVRRTEVADVGAWVDAAVEGWSEFPEYAGEMRELSRISVARGPTWFVELDGTIIATGVMYMAGGVALLAGASTIPSARRLGAQSALLEHRLRHAAAMGCDIAMMCALPGSASQRNAERNGFRIAYTRIKWGGTAVGSRGTAA